MAAAGETDPCSDGLRKTSAAIPSDGTISRSTFDDKNLFLPWYGGFYDAAPFSKHAGSGGLWDVFPWDAEYLEEIKDVASAFGYAPEAIDSLARQGFTPEELEEFLYCGEL